MVSFSVLNLAYSCVCLALWGAFLAPCPLLFDCVRLHPQWQILGLSIGLSSHSCGLLSCTNAVRVELNQPTTLFNQLCTSLARFFAWLDNLLLVKEDYALAP